MAFDTGSTKLALWSSNLFHSLTENVRALLGMNKFTPEETLAEAQNVDPRLVPKVPMQSADIDTNLLLELSKIGMKHGKLVTEASHPELMQSWKIMSARAGLKKAPQLIIVESKTINAMTVSPEEVVMTTGLLKKLDLREVCAVLGHELGHAMSDHKRPRIAATVLFGSAGAYAGQRMFSKMNVAKLEAKSRLLPYIAELLSLSVGASLGAVVANQVSVKPTELQADLKGAEISGDPEGLISALRKLEASRTRSPLTNALAHLHSGYPSTEQRIHNLQTVAKHMPKRIESMPLTVVKKLPGSQVTGVAADERLESASPQVALN